MFEEKRMLFYYAITPVHMGAGQSLGVIDNPIQREPHTGWPYFAGSGIKGALRDVAESEWGKKGKVDRWFGPEAGRNELHAGAVSFTDAQLVAFPARSLKEGFVYLTSPLALQRLARMAAQAGLHCEALQRLAQAGAPGESEAWVSEAGKQKLCENGKLVLEAYEFAASVKGELAELGAWLGQKALPPQDAFSFFQEKLARDLVVVSDAQLSFFVRNSTFVEPHVRIDDETGTADDGGLFFTENLPPESLLVGLLMTSQERKQKRAEESEARAEASEIIKELAGLLQGKQVVQFGGDATTGRGLVAVAVAGGE